MPDNASILKNLYKIVVVDTNYLPTLIRNQYLPPPAGGQLGAVKAGANITIAPDGTISSSGGAGSGVTSVGTTITAFDFSNPTTTPTLNIVGGNDGQFLSSDGTWETPALPNPPIPVVNFISSATPSAGQTFTNIVLAQYTSADYLDVSVAGSTLNRANYSLTGSTLTISAFLPASVMVQVEPSAASVVAGNVGTVTSFNLASPLTNAFNVTTSNTTPTLRITTPPTPTTVFLRGDGTWASPTGGAVTSVALAAPSGFLVSGSPLTSAGTLTLSYSGQIPTSSLGTGTTTISTYLAGNGQWLSIPTGGFAGITAVQTLTNKTLTSPAINNATANALTLTGSLTANGTTGTNGQVLSTTSTGVQWVNQTGGGGGANDWLLAFAIS